MCVHYHSHRLLNRYTERLHPTEIFQHFHKIAFQHLASNGLFHLGDIKFDVGVHLQEFVVGGMDLVLNVLLQVHHLVLC